MGIVEALQAQLPSLLEESDEAHHQAVMSICQLISPENLDLLIPFINCGNMYVEQDIPYIFAFHNYREALPALEDAAENGSVHVKTLQGGQLAFISNSALINYQRTMMAYDFYS